MRQSSCARTCSMYSREYSELRESLARASTLLPASICLPDRFLQTLLEVLRLRKKRKSGGSFFRPSTRQTNRVAPTKRHYYRDSCTSPPEVREIVFVIAGNNGRSRMRKKKKQPNQSLQDEWDIIDPAISCSRLSCHTYIIFKINHIKVNSFHNILSRSSV